MKFAVDSSGVLFAHVEVQPILIEKIRHAQDNDVEIQDYLVKMREGKLPGFRVDN